MRVLSNIYNMPNKTLTLVHEEVQQYNNQRVYHHTFLHILIVLMDCEAKMQHDNMNSLLNHDMAYF